MLIPGSIFISSVLFLCINAQKKIREKGESDYPFLVNMWIPKNNEIKQEKSRFCDAVQLTPFTDYFFTSARCFDNLQHGMWLEDIGISWDERIVSYSRHMSFLTRYKEEGGHFVILERFETNPLEELKEIEKTKDSSKNKTTVVEETIDEIEKPVEIEEMTKSSGLKALQETMKSKNHAKDKPATKKSEISNIKEKIPEDDEEDYEDLPQDLSQYDDVEDQYEIKEQLHADDADMKILRSLRRKKVRLTTPDIRGATECYVLGWGTYLKSYNDIRDLDGIILRKEVVTKLPRRICRSTDPSHVCVIKEDENRECVEDLGSPLVCEKRDMRNNTIGVALVGIYTGFKNCVTTETGIFRSLSSELPWIARWARGTPISTSGFMAARSDYDSDDDQPRGRRRRRRRRGRAGGGGGGTNSIYSHSFFTLYFYIVSFFSRFIFHYV